MTAAEPHVVGSIARFFKMAFDGVDLRPIRQSLASRLRADSNDAAAWIDLSVLEQLAGNRSAGLLCQSEAFKLQRLYRSGWPSSPKALRVLAFMTEGDVSTNIPIDFLLEGFDVVLYTLYLSERCAIPSDLPEHDVAIVAIADSDRALSLLHRVEEELLPVWPCPILNRPSSITLHSREKMYRHLVGIPELYMPPTVRLQRGEFHSLIEQPSSLRELLLGASLPIIARPVDSHAGNGLEKLEDTEGIAAYLQTHPELEFYVSPFIDYRSADGLFRKYRIVWVDGRPYPVHMAIAEEWKVWYLNAGMAAHAWKRVEEEQFLTAFDGGFGLKHARALEGIAKRFGLEYFGIDCAELPDGRLLVFEGSVALAVHDMDPREVYSYKSPQMQRVFAAFYQMLRRKSRVCTAEDQRI